MTKLISIALFSMLGFTPLFAAEQPAATAQTVYSFGIGPQQAASEVAKRWVPVLYLKQLLVAKIKIDKSFVMEMSTNKSDAVIVRSTIDLGHNLGLKVIAEGVEDAECWAKLKELGCDAAQGYFMSRPLSAEKFSEWLTHSPWAGPNEESINFPAQQSAQT